MISKSLSEANPTIDNIRLLCKSHNLMKAEQHLGRAFMAKFRSHNSVI